MISKTRNIYLFHLYFKYYFWVISLVIVWNLYELWKDENWILTFEKRFSNGRTVLLLPFLGKRTFYLLNDRNDGIIIHKNNIIQLQETISKQ